MANGIILYSFSENNPKPELAPAPMPEKEKERGYSFAPSTNPENPAVFWGTLCGVLIIGGTLIEDYLTGGAGIADDAASFALAYELMSGH